MLKRVLFRKSTITTRFTRKEICLWLKTIGGVTVLCALLFFCNAALLQFFSYAVNGLVYNMTTGCLFTETHCNQTIVFYANSGLARLAGWSFLITMLMIGVLVTLTVLYRLILRHYPYDRDAYTLASVNGLPDTPTGAIYEEVEFDLDEDDDSL